MLYNCWEHWKLPVLNRDIAYPTRFPMLKLFSAKLKIKIITQAPFQHITTEPKDGKIAAAFMVDKMPLAVFDKACACGHEGDI